MDGSIDEIHLSHFKPRVLQRLLEGSGFRVVENSLDPQYAATGFKSVLWTMFYSVSTLIRFVFRINLYETTWVIARKT